MPHYPASLENFWVQHTLRQLGIDSLAAKQHLLEQRIQQLSDAFTKERDTISKAYFHDPLTLCAYGLFYFPQTYIRALFAVRELIQRGWNSQDRSILDLGAGMGAASLAIASLISNAQITAVDRSHEALALMEQIAADLNQPIETQTEDLVRWCSRNQKRFDLIVASFSLSELNVSSGDWTKRFDQMLTEDGMVLILEPSLKETSEWLEQWRDEISEQNDFHIWAPCLHSRKCPLLQTGKFWCHEVRSWQPPQSLAFINRRLYREVHVTRFSFLAFGKRCPQKISGFAARMISPVSKVKRNYLLSGCASDGAAHAFRISGRNLDPEKRTLIRKWERGDILMEDEKGIQILESDLLFVVQNRQPTP